MSEAQWDYETIVRNAAHMVHDGVIGLDDVCIPGYIEDNDWSADFTDEEIREDVAEMLASVEKKTEKTQTIGAGGYDDIDWSALWSEFGFDTPDAVGFAGASHAQLALALSCTTQNVSINPETAITSAVEDGILDEVEATTPNGRTVRQGFRLGSDV